MATEYEPARACEVVGVFHTPEDLESAIDELLRSGFDRAELSLLASENAVAEKLGGYYRPASELANDPAVPRTAFVSTAAIGDAEGGLIGGLAYLGATVGAVVMSGGDAWRSHRRRRARRRRRRASRVGACVLGRPSSRRLSA